MKRTFFIAVILLFACSAALLAQEEGGKTGFDKSKLFFGGNFGLSFGDYTLVNVSPQIGYRFNEYLAAGAGPNFIYSGYRVQNFDGSTYSRESLGVAGLNVFGRVYPIEQILLQVQPELNYVWGQLKIYGPPDYIQKQSKIVPSLLLGGGAAIPAGRGVFLATVFYDVIQDPLSPYYKRAVYNFGYNIGF